MYPVQQTTVVIRIAFNDTDVMTLDTGGVGRAFDRVSTPNTACQNVHSNGQSVGRTRLCTEYRGGNPVERYTVPPSKGGRS